MDFFYHLGVHKTGSTLIQNNLAKNLTALRDQGVFYVNAELPKVILRKRNALRKMLNGLPHEQSREVIENLNDIVTERAQSAGMSKLLFSEENFLGQPVQNQKRTNAKPSFYPQARQCVELVTLGHNRGRLSLMLYSRQHESYLRSLYSEALTNLAAIEDGGEFYADFDFSTFRYGRLIDELSEIVPMSQIRMREFETIRDGAECFLSQFISDLGLDFRPFVFDTRTVRASIDADQQSKLMKLAKLMASGEGAPRVMRRKARRILSHPADPNRKLVLPDWIRITCDEIAKSDQRTAG